MYRIPIYKVQLIRDSSQRVPRKQISEPKTAAEILSFYLHGQDRENLVVILLDVRNRVIGINTVSMGSLTQAIVHPREVFKPAILSNAHAIIIGHNHPSGDPSPSDEDLDVTRTLREAGEALQIPLLDHIITGDDGVFTSMVELGILPPYAQ